MIRSVLDARAFLADIRDAAPNLARVDRRLLARELAELAVELDLEAATDAIVRPRR